MVDMRETHTYAFSFFTISVDIPYLLIDGTRSVLRHGSEKAWSSCGPQLHRQQQQEEERECQENRDNLSSAAAGERL